MTPGRVLMLLLLWPIGEIVSMLLMAEAVGALATIALLALGVLAGVATLRFAGRTAVAELRAEARQGGVLDPRILFGASRMAVAGILLIVPGFLSDVGAILLLAGTAFGPTPRRLGRPPAVIDVAVDRRSTDESRRGGAGF